MNKKDDNFYKNSLNQFKTAISKQYLCNNEDFNSNNNVFIKSFNNEKLIFKSPFKICSFGEYAVFSIENNYENLFDEIPLLFSKVPIKDVLLSENLYKLNQLLKENKLSLKANCTRYILKSNQIKLNEKPLIGKTKWFFKDSVKLFWNNENFKNAMAGDESDTLAVGVFENDNIIALAGCDNKLDNKFRQIGIDVLPEYRGFGLGSYLVKLLSYKIIEEGYIPYYTTWTSNLTSTKLAISCGYVPISFENHAIKI